MSTLFGRARECAALDAAVARARTSEGGSLIVTGGPGAGKSALLDYVMNSAGDAGTLRIEGLESEAEIEVGHELAARGTPPSALLDEPLPVGYRLRRHYESQIRRVPEETRQLLLLAAANMGSAPRTL